MSLYMKLPNKNFKSIFQLSYKCQISHFTGWHLSVWYMTEEEIFSVTQPSILILQAYILACLHPATFMTGPQEYTEEVNYSL